MEEFIETLKEHSKRIPCFSCIVRNPCSSFDEITKQIRVRTICDKFKNWQDIRDDIVFGLANRVVSIGVLEVLETEKKSR